MTNDGRRIQSRWLSQNRHVAAAIALYALMCLSLFGDLVFSPHLVLSCRGGDTWNGELAGRIAFLPELRKGHLVLWNPYMFSGTPLFTKSQVPFLYPGEWLGMYLSPRQSINLTLSLHTFLAGLFCFVWARYRQLSFWASFISGTIYMFSGPFYLHVYGGQVNNVTTMAWVPLIFLAIDRIAAGETRAGVLLGTFALAMQLYASQPQYTLFTIIGTVIYVSIRLILKTCSFRAFVLSAGACIWAFAIATLELVPTMIQNEESLRSSSGVPMSYAGIISLPPINLITTFAPGILGDDLTIPYLGHSAFFETSLFMGSTGIVLALFGACFGAMPGRKTLLGAGIVLLVFAMGSYTPIFPFLYQFVPGIRLLRGMSKFAFLSVLFFSLLAGAGFDAVRSVPKQSGRIIALPIIFASLLFIGCFVIDSTFSLRNGGSWGWVLQELTYLKQTALSYAEARNPTYLQEMGQCASKQLITATLWLLATSGAIYGLKRTQKAAFGLVFLVAIQSWGYAKAYRATFDVRDLPAVSAEQAKVIGDDRVSITENPNQSMALRVSAVNGYDSNSLRRYVEFVANAQGKDVNDFKTLVSSDPVVMRPLLRLVRLKWNLVTERKDLQLIPNASPLPHALLIDRCHVIDERDKIFAAMTKPDFDPGHEVILEQYPAIRPVSGDGPAGTVTITGQTSETLDLSADLNRPAILLVTDSYSRYWQVSEPGSSSQNADELLPADYTLRAIPLASGHHRLHMQYVAPFWKQSEVITFLSIGIWILVLIFPAKYRRLASPETNR